MAVIDEKKRILVWGTGKLLQENLGKLEEILRNGEYELAGFIDKNPAREGVVLLGKPISGIERILNLNFDFVVIATGKEFYPEIKEQLISNWQIDEKKIYSYTWFSTAKLHAKCQSAEAVRVFDCFPFFNEMDILELRLDLLDEYVDYFVLVEMNKTHRWENKPLNFAENRERYRKYAEKIIYVCPKELPIKTSDKIIDWTLENFQRNCISDGLLGKANAQDIILISDVDEIPNPDVVEDLRKNVWRLDYDILSFSQEFFYYSFKYKHLQNWNGTCAVKYMNLQKPQDIRNVDGALPEIKNAGWHLSYFGGAQMAVTKTRNIIVDNEEEMMASLDEVKRRVQEGVDPYGRKGTEFELINVDFESLNFPRKNEYHNKFSTFFAD